MRRLDIGYVGFDIFILVTVFVISRIPERFITRIRDIELRQLIGNEQLTGMEIRWKFKSKPYPVIKHTNP